MHNPHCGTQIVTDKADTLGEDTGHSCRTLPWTVTTEHSKIFGMFTDSAMHAGR